jgi:hypothetical protein
LRAPVKRVAADCPPILCSALSIALDLVLIPLVLALNALACDLSKTGATPATDNEFRGTSRR